MITHGLHQPFEIDTNLMSYEAETQPGARGMSQETSSSESTSLNCLHWRLRKTSNRALGRRPILCLFI